MPNAIFFSFKARIFLCLNVDSGTLIKSQLHIKGFSDVYDSLHCCGVTEREPTLQVALRLVNDHIIGKTCFLRKGPMKTSRKLW